MKYPVIELPIKRGELPDEHLCGDRQLFSRFQAWNEMRFWHEHRTVQLVPEWRPAAPILEVSDVDR